MTVINLLIFITIFFSICLLRGLKKPKSIPGNTRFSVIIACKNEEKNLKTLFESIEKIAYPDWEVILIDDNSTDNTFEMLIGFCTKAQNRHAFSLGENSPKGKIQAIRKGIAHSNFEWIALTDADCLLPNDWLKCANQNIFRQKSPSMLIGYSPEIYRDSFQYFRQLATAINYAASTYAKLPFSCNGRNLFFLKDDFHKVGGYNDIPHYLFGEDKLLMYKFYHNHKRISYMPQPPVYTFPVDKDKARNQNLRRFAAFSLSSVFWQIFTVLIGLSLLYAPIELYLKGNFFSGLALLLTAFSYIYIGCIIHCEKVRLSYFIYLLIFPFYVAIQILKSKIYKWSWR